MQLEQDCDKESHLFSVFYLHSAIDHMLSELSRQFSKKQSELIRKIVFLNAKVKHFLNTAHSLNAVVLNPNTVDLWNEMNQFKILREKNRAEKPKNLPIQRSFTEPYIEVF